MTAADNAMVASTAYRDLSGTGADLTREGYEEILAVAGMVMSAQTNRAFVEELELLEPSDLVGELVSKDKLGQLVQASSDALSFTKQLYAALRHTLIDLHRQTDAGALARRIVQTLRRTDHFEQSDVAAEQGQWTSPDTAPEGQWDGDLNVLVNAAWGVDVTPVTEWKGDRRTPVCSDSDLISILDAILAGGQSPLNLSDIVYAVQHRFGLLYSPLASLEGVTHRAHMSVSTESEALGAVDAGETVELLSVEELLILDSTEMTDRELAVELCCSPTTAGNKRRRLTDTLEGLGWTETDGAPSSSNDDGRQL